MGPAEVEAPRVKLYASMARRKNPHAVALGSRGGKARAKKLSPEQRSAIAQKAGKIGGKVRATRLTEEEQTRIGAHAQLGGKARAEKLSATERTEIARRAAEARWSKAKQDSVERGGPTKKHK